MCTKLKRRCALLSLTGSFVEGALNSIKYTLTPPDRIMLSFHCPEDSFFYQCRAKIMSGMDFRSSWSESMSECSDIGALNADEKETFSEVGRSLGIYDRDGQAAVLERLRHELAVQCESARRDKLERSRLYMSCSTLTGMLAAIVII